MSAKTGKRPLRTMTPNEKLEAIRRVHDGESKASVARDIGVPESTLRGWCKNEEKISYLSRNQSSSPESIVNVEPKEKRTRIDEPVQPFNLSLKHSTSSYASSSKSMYTPLDYSKNDPDTAHKTPQNLSLKPETPKSGSQTTDSEYRRAELARISQQFSLNQPEVYTPPSSAGSITETIQNLAILTQLNNIAKEAVANGKKLSHVEYMTLATALLSTYPGLSHASKHMTESETNEYVKFWLSQSYMKLYPNGLHPNGSLPTNSSHSSSSRSNATHSNDVNGVIATSSTTLASVTASTTTSKTASTSSTSNASLESLYQQAFWNPYNNNLNNNNIAKTNTDLLHLQANYPTLSSLSATSILQNQSITTPTSSTPSTTLRPTTTSPIRQNNTPSSPVVVRDNTPTPPLPPTTSTLTVSSSQIVNRISSPIQQPDNTGTTPTTGKQILYKQLTKDPNDIENFTKDVSTINGKKRKKMSLEDLFNNNNHTRTEKKENGLIEETITKEEALEHGRKFMEWLEECSSPLVTAQQLTQLKNLLNNLKNGEKVRFKAKEPRK